MGIGLVLGGMGVFVGFLTLLGRADGDSWRSLVKASVFLALVLGAALLLVWVNS